MQLDKQIFKKIQKIENKNGLSTAERIVLHETMYLADLMYLTSGRITQMECKEITDFAKKLIIKYSNADLSEIKEEDSNKKQISKLLH